MLNPTGSETPTAQEDAAQRTRARPAPPNPLDIDPSWRAGRKLEEARRQLGLSFEQVSSRIRVRREFLEALESMNAKLLPGKAYALAYLRSYAQLLGLDPKAIVEQFQEECALSREDDRAQIRSPESRPHPERPWIAALTLVVVAVSFVAWRALQEEEAPPPAASTETAEAPPAAASGPLAARPDIEIRAIAEAWLEVRGPDGTVFVSRTLRPGEAYRPDSSPGWTIHARDGGAFQVYVDGQPAGALGLPGKPVLGRQIDDIEAPAPPPAAPVTTLAPPPRPAPQPAPRPAPPPPAQTPAPAEALALPADVPAAVDRPAAAPAPNPAPPAAPPAAAPAG